MKKIFLLLTVIFSCLLFTGCSSLKTISFDELKEKMDNKESFISYMYRMSNIYFRSNSN